MSKSFGKMLVEEIAKDPNFISLDNKYDYIDPLTGKVRDDCLDMTKGRKLPNELLKRRVKVMQERFQRTASN